MFSAYHTKKKGEVSDTSITWDCVYFGRYYQNDKNGDGKANEQDTMQPIKWRVLSVSDGNMVLLSDQLPDYYGVIIKKN